MRLTAAMILVILLACACRCAASDETLRSAVVRVGNCSGVCVSSGGLVLTAKHCRIPAATTVVFGSRTVPARRVWVTPHREGPVVLDADGDGYPYVPIAAAAPQIGARVFSMGFRDGNFSRMEGTLTGHTRSGDGYPLAVTDFRVFRGNSGGPLFDSRGGVIGLASMTTMDRGPLGQYREQPHRSFWISWADVRAAVEAALSTPPDADIRPAPRSAPGETMPKPLLYVFTQSGCRPCEEFKRDVAAGHFDDFQVEFLSAGSPRFREVYQTMHAQLARPPRRFAVPAFWIAGSSRVQIGYSREQRLGLINWLLETIRHHLVPSVLWRGDDRAESLPPEPQLGEPPKFERNPLTDVRELAAQVKEIRGSVATLRSEQSGVLDKVRNALALKSEVPELRRRIGELKQKVEHPKRYIDWWWGLLGAAAGMAKRRWLDAGS